MGGRGNFPQKTLKKFAIYKKEGFKRALRPEIYVDKTYMIDYLFCQYDGYVFWDGIHVYNPKSVVDVMRNRKFRSFGQIQKLMKRCRFILI